MARELKQLLRSLFWPAARVHRQAPWEPSADVYRTRTGWLVKFDLAGVRPEDVRLELTGSRLTLHGVRRDYFREESCRCYRMEISYSQFERSLELPDDLRQANISTQYRDGMLLVAIRTEEVDK